ncbi:MAG: recombinase family protein [Gammaproteobacteria bacterium]|nr:recombinase family protein [Gammaproteobacteria bacterium]
METIKQVGIWIRVSTEMQVKDESPEHHEQRARYYTQSRNWNVAEVYRLEAVSGKTVMQHSETQRMLKDIKTGRITGLVFSKLARLARSTKELLEFADIFRKEGADLISLAEQIDTSSPAGRLFFTIISAMAEWEREEISSRVSASIPIRAKMGKPLGGQASFGYKWLDKELVIDEQEAPIRKLLYELFIECQRKKTTADKLNALGHRTRNGSEFSDTTVHRLLRDPTAKGERRANYTKSLGDGKQWIIKPEEDWVVTACPAIIDEDLWHKCNSILDEQETKRIKTGRKSEYLLAGFVKCECGKSMYVTSTAKNYTCTVCKNRISVADLDEIFQEHLKGYLNDINPQTYFDEAEMVLKEKEQLLSLTIKKRAQLRKQMDELVPLRLNGELDKAHFAELYKPLETQVHQLDSSIPELDAEVDFRKIQLVSSEEVLIEAKALYKEWADMAFEKKRSIIETITEQIAIGKDSITISLAYDSISPNEQTSQHNFILALPCLRYRKNHAKPLPKSCLIDPQTIGEHIKKRRMDLGLFQRDIAQLWNVTEETITNWENGYSEPQIGYYARIAMFLGYEWWRFDISALSGRIQDYRYRNGLSAKRLGQLLGVNMTTIRSWELEERVPRKEQLENLNLLLETTKPLE